MPDTAHIPLENDKLDHAGYCLVTRGQLRLDVLVEQFDDMALVSHGGRPLDVARVSEKAGGRVDGYVCQELRVGAVGDVVLDEGVRCVWAAI